METRILKLEQNIQRLKTVYEQYFAGVERRPPDKLAETVAREVRSLTATVINNTALRFRAQQAISRYNTYLSYWQKNLRDLEEGRKPKRRVTGGAVPEESPTGVFEVSTSRSERSEMEKLFSALSREYRKIGNGKTPDMAKVRKALEDQTKAIREKYGCEKVAFRVVNEGGKVKIKAAPAERRKT
ncbi:MAG: hypothetical protein JSV00_00635 [bacterium]|nr:MAG: hypothetical protein JSV00_00635 [bacterium]